MTNKKITLTIPKIDRFMLFDEKATITPGICVNCGTKLIVDTLSTKYGDWCPNEDCGPEDHITIFPPWKSPQDFIFDNLHEFGIPYPK